jgi:hypothetical protein
MKKEGKKKLSVSEFESLKSMKGKCSMRQAVKIYGVSLSVVQRLWK